MIRRILMAAVALGAAIPARAGDLGQAYVSARAAAIQAQPEAFPFESKESAERKDPGGSVWARVEEGKSGGRPAWRLTLVKERRSYAMVRLDKVRSWGEARSACRGLPGSWDLPTVGEYRLLERANAPNVRIKLGRPDDWYFPLWIRSTDEPENQRRLAGTTEVFGLTGKGPEDWLRTPADKAAVAELKKRKEQYQDMERARFYRNDDEERQVQAALVDYKRRTGVDLDPNVQHPGKLPAHVHSMMQRPSREAVESGLLTLLSLHGTVKEGYSPYCVRRAP